MRLKSFHLTDGLYFPVVALAFSCLRILRAVTKPELLIAAVQQEILDPNLPVYRVKTLDQYRREYLSNERLRAALIGGLCTQTKNGHLSMPVIY
jgi:hypothetical protein